ncbi:hypothetical protein Ruko_04820 [Ruthenibacterium sp. TH_2024_36131]|uniref:RNA polymerase sigma factor n=1 Tax=Owariibacterium komagatae TaxID=3136601 RepID=UPI0038B29ACB
MEKETLLVQLQKRDEAALEELIEQYGGWVTATVRAAGAGLLEAPDVEEAAAETFLKLWNAASNIDLAKGSLKSYLGAVARNEARSRVRALRPVLPMEEDFLSQADEQLQQHLERKEQSAIIRKALDFLEPVTKEIFLRYYYQRQKVAEIAEELGMNPSTVKSRLARGRDVLRRALQERGISHEDVV